MININDSYFDGSYKDIWRALIPAELTEKETAFMLQYFNLKPGARVLDIMCGYGRHALALAEKGVEVTAIDNLGDYINEISNTAREKSLPVKAVKASATDYEAEGFYELAICMGNSLNFFPEHDTKQILSNIAVHLRPGGQLMINSWSIAEIAIPQFKERTWTRMGDMKIIAESKFLFHPTRIETETLILKANGESETKNAIDYVFAIAEYERMLTECGFAIREIYSIPGRKKFSLGEPRAYIISSKNP